MVPLNPIVRKCTGKLHNSQEKLSILRQMDGIKQFAKNKRELATLIQSVRIYNQDIETKFDPEKYVIL